MRDGFSKRSVSGRVVDKNLVVVLLCFYESESAALLQEPNE